MGWVKLVGIEWVLSPEISEAITLRSYNYPIDAIKELLANAVYNRSYKCTAEKAHAPWPWDERR